MSRRLVRAAAAALRLDGASAWLAARAPGEEVLVVAATSDAANELLRTATRGRGAAFGWHRATLPRLAASLAAEHLATLGLVPVGRLGLEALVARVLHALREEEALGRFADVADGPGLAQAAASALEELRLAGVHPQALEPGASGVRAIAEAVAEALEEAGLADRARVLALAIERARAAAAHPLLDRPTLLLDLPVTSALEAELVAAVAARAPDVLATLPAGEAAGARRLESALAVAAESLDPTTPPESGSLAALQVHLFEDTAPAEAALGDSVELFSAPGESRECVEIARRIHGLARDGIPFDRMAILLRSAEQYRPHLAEAFGRAGIPVHFARGAVHPDPAGRAFSALLACAEEGLSARAFSEYLSLGEVPDATAAGAPPPEAPPEERWVAPDEDMVPAVVAGALGDAARLPELVSDLEPAPDAETAPVAAGSLRAPRRWERLLVDAAVIGGRDRWMRRLDGLRGEFEIELEELEDREGPSGDRFRRALADLESLRGFALPLLGALDALPRRASWGEWLDALTSLATRALRHPNRVLSVLAELTPMAPVGPVDLGEVRLVLGRRLLELATPPPASRYGHVFVGPTESARGLVFDVVFVPGLAERLFPRKIGEDPMLLDTVRAEISPELATNRDRRDFERLALRVAAGAARTRLVLSYPRLDLDQSRPRVPSFYALEARRAAQGRLPGFDELAADAERVGQARIGWPAPSRSDDAIDEAEHDLALLEGLADADEAHLVGRARYLLTANPYLGRALRFRARRWLPNWTQADGLVPPPKGELSAEARAAIARHAFSERSYSPTALQNYAACPYKFYLHAVHRLAPREVPEEIEELSPLQRGSLVHDVQFELFGVLRDDGLLPVTPERLPEARARLDTVLDAVAARYHDDLAPAIERVFQDGVEGVRADLREWLRRSAADSSGFVPWRFELSFGLSGRRARDPHSTPEPVALDAGIALRGSIDLVERHAEGRLRATDHKTGKERMEAGGIIAGGEVLQPVLYALAVEKLLPDARVESGRLYYCTSAGGFGERSVPLDQAARDSARAVAETIGTALHGPFLPAAPAEGACRWCDYATVCGPYEELRTSRKWPAPLEPLRRLREMP